jgi:hypothetical protein
MHDAPINRGVHMSDVVDSWMLGRARVHRIEEWCGPFLTPQLLFAGFDADADAACKEAVPPDYLDAASDARCWRRSGELGHRVGRRAHLDRHRRR